MSTGRRTDDRDTDYRRHKEIIKYLQHAKERLAVMEQRLERLEMELLRPPTKTYPGYGYDPRGGE